MWLCIQLTWHRYVNYLTLICYTWHLIPDTWYLTPVLNMLSPDTWYLTPDTWHAITHLTCFQVALVHLTWCCDTWLDYYYTYFTMSIHDYHFYGDLAWLLYYYQTSGTPELLCYWSSFPAHENKILDVRYQVLRDNMSSTGVRY